MEESNQQREQLVDDLKSKGSQKASAAVKAQFPPSEKDITDLDRKREEDDYDLSKAIVSAKRSIIEALGFAAVIAILAAALFAGTLLLKYGMHLYADTDKLVEFLKDLWKVAAGACATITAQHLILKTKVRE